MLQPFDTCCFFRQNIGTPPMAQGNVQVYNVRIPVCHINREKLPKGRALSLRDPDSFVW